MKKALADGLTALLLSKKFLASMFGAIANLTLYLGFELDVDQAMGITSPILAMILGQTVVDVRKAGKPPSPPTDVINATNVSLLLLLVLAVGGLAGCDKMKASSARATANFIDCMKPNTKALAGELTSVVSSVLRDATGNDGKVDWTSVKATVGTFKSDAPMCAFRSAIIEALRPRVATADAPQSSPLPTDSADLSAGYESIRVGMFSGRLAPIGSAELQ